MAATTDNQNSTRKDWLFFFVSFAVTVALLIFFPAWFWITLPFPLTYLTKALNAM